jgi:hypothetical protein
MIIDIGGVQTSIDVKVGFSPLITRAIKYQTLSEGTLKERDKGEQADKHSSSFSIPGDSVNIEALAEELWDHNGQVSLTVDRAAEVFGPAVDYSSPILCNVLRDPLNYRKTDILTAGIALRVQVVGPLTYRAEIPAGLPTLRYQFPIDREFSKAPSTFISANNTDYGVAQRVDSSGDNVKVEKVSFTVRQTRDQAAQIQKFMRTQRATPYTLETSDCLTLFFTSNSTSVKFTAFSMKRKKYNLYEVRLTAQRVN